MRKIRKLLLDSMQIGKTHLTLKWEFHQTMKQAGIEMKLLGEGGGVWQILTELSHRKRMWMGFFT